VLPTSSPTATLRRFARRAQSTPAVGLFAMFALASQLVVGHRLGHGVGTALVYAAASFAFVLVAAVIVRHLSSPRPEVPLAAPRWQLSIVLAFVAVHCVYLLPQLPRGAMRVDLTSHALARAVAWMSARIGVGATMTTLFGLLPVACLLPFARGRDDFGLGAFPLRPLLGLLPPYALLFVLAHGSVRTLLPTMASYLFMAALPEEILYRALLQARLRAFFDDALIPIVIASTVFGLMHLPINVARHGWLLGTAFCLGANAFGGFFFGYVYHRTRSLPLVVAVHVVAGIAAGGAR
jgi:membrane protease YdiL (CAAX protease family)